MFHSEADFQHALAWQIHEAAPESQVRLEVSVIPVEAQRMFLDIWLPVEGIAIELKYKTRGLELEQTTSPLPSATKAHKTKGGMISSGIFRDLSSCALSWSSAGLDTQCC